MGVLEQTVFDRIMPALCTGQADFGVCIHEGRFTYREQGLHLVEDLGERWERETGVPLPLGGLLVRRDWEPGLQGILIRVLADSLAYAWAHRDEALLTMRRHAQELDDAVIQAHVDLYVNEWTRELGDSGREALRVLHDRAVQLDLVASDQPPLTVLDHPA